MHDARHGRVSRATCRHTRPEAGRAGRGAPPPGTCRNARMSPRRFRPRSSALSASAGTLAAASSSLRSSIKGTCRPVHILWPPALHRAQGHARLLLALKIRRSSIGTWDATSGTAVSAAAPCTCMRHAVPERASQLCGCTMQPSPLPLRLYARRVPNTRAMPSHSARLPMQATQNRRVFCHTPNPNPTLSTHAACSAWPGLRGAPGPRPPTRRACPRSPRGSPAGRNRGWVSPRSSSAPAPRARPLARLRPHGERLGRQPPRGLQGDGEQNAGTNQG